MVTLNGALPLSTAQDGRTHSQWHSDALIGHPDPGTSPTIVLGDHADMGLIIRGASGQTGNLTEWQDSTGATLARISNNGLGAFANLATTLIREGSWTGPYLSFGSAAAVMLAGAANQVPFAARGAASQTANLQEWQNSGASPLFAVTSAGIPKWSASSNIQTTVGAAGGASALPATPIKYLKIQDNSGNTYVIPCYNP